MLVDELREKLKEIEPDLSAIKAFWANNNLEESYQKLHEQIHQPDFWQHKDQIIISQEYQNVKDLRENYQSITSIFYESKDLIEMFAEDENELQNVAKDLTELHRNVAKFKINLLLSKEDDKRNCYLNINAGAGGTESQDWANMLLRMYLRFCEKEKFSTAILDIQSGDEAGIKSATIYVKGKNAYGILKCEAGTHRLVRISPFDSNKRRHTSFAGVSITPEIASEKVEIQEEPFSFFNTLS